MIPFAMIMRNKLDDCATEMTLADRNQPIQTLFFDRADEAFRVGVRSAPDTVSGSRRRW